MKAVDMWIGIGFLLGVMTVCTAKRGFILTAPKAIDAGTTEYFTFTAFDMTHKGVVTLKLLHWYTDELLAETTIDVHSNLNMWVEMVVPPSPTDLRAKLRAVGSFSHKSDNYKIDAVKEVLVRHSSVVTFVQTDKPVYKPGQTVRFRVLPLNSQLRPLAPNTVADIWMEDPSNIRISQWKQVNFTDGMVQLELPLSEEPPLGKWSIKTTIHQVSHTHKFSVEKYVLPKFDVKINPPVYIMADADSIPLEICAWYTYGKKVDGTFKAKITYKKYQWEGKRKAIPSVEHTGLISGCQIVHVNTQDILLQTREFGFRTLEFFAEVTENTTAISGNATATSDITHSPLEMKFLGTEGSSDYFKPGIPFYGELSVHKPNGVPAANEKIEICAKIYSPETHSERVYDGFHSSTRRRLRRSAAREPDSNCDHFKSDKRGRVKFSLPPQSTLVKKVELQAQATAHHPLKYREGEWVSKVDRPGCTLSLHPWYTPSGHHVQIEPHPDPMECERPQRVRVRYTTQKGASIKFYHQVLSRGRIVQQGSHQRTYHAKEGGEPERYDFGGSHSSTPHEVGEFLLSFDPRAPMSPAARLLVFYVREDGEIVADSRKFKIAHCLPNKVSVQFRHEQQYPNTDASILLSATPHSVCGIGLVDKSIRLLSRENQFKRENIFKVMERYDVGKENAPHQVSEDYCMQKEVSDGGLGPSRTYYHSLTRKISEHVDTSMAFEEAGMVVISNFELETRPCVETQPVAIPYSYDMMVAPGLPGLPPDSLVRSLVPMNRVAPSRPSSAVPKIADVEEPPKKETVEEEEIRSYFPETWLWEMHTVGASGESALKRRLPHTITRWVGGAVCVHPKSGLGLSDEATVTAFQPFFLSFRLPYSVVRGELLPLQVTVFNYLTECLPIKLSLEASDEFESLSGSRFHTMCVCGGESRGHRFPVRPTTLGRVNVTVYGFSLEDDDACGNEVTARLSARDAVSRQLLVEAEGFPKEEIFNYFVCPETTNGSYATEVDLLLPEDVVEGSSRAYVSVTGDLLGPALNGLSRLVRLPVGCGEQNMVLFTPNIFVLDYLAATGKTTPDIKTECISNMKTGYQRELKYRHADGSYSAFGERDPEGSLWLTAFVVRSFGAARRFVDVDEQDLGLSTAWILSKQFENGCFEPSGFMLNKAMKGGLESSDHSLAPLTAYVLISLLESGAQRPEQAPVRNALSCLRAEANPSSYAMALFAYAAALAKEPALAEKYLRQLEARAIIKGSHMYWEESGDGGSGGLSVGVETAGYYVLARTQGGGREAGVLAAVRWIVQQRNAHGGFVSTQDTVVALQALARHSSLPSSASPLDMGLVVEGDDLVKGFKLEEHNKLVTQTANIPVLPAVLELQAVGEGCAMVQFSLRYNVARITSSQAFDLNIDAQRLGSSNCNLPRIGICMRYKVPDQTSNMVVVSVKMASGFLPDEWSLYELQSDTTVQLMRHEVDGNQVNLYFNELTNDQKCFQFFIKSELEVEDIKPSTIKLYDYYQPDLEITKEYTIPTACVISELPQMPTLPFLLEDQNGGSTLPSSIEVPFHSSNPATTTSEGITITWPTQTVEDLDEETMSVQTATTAQEHIPDEHSTTDDADSTAEEQTDKSNQLQTSETTGTTGELTTNEATSEELVAAEAEGSEMVDGTTQESEDYVRTTQTSAAVDIASVVTQQSEPTGIVDEETEEPAELLTSEVSTVEILSDEELVTDEIVTEVSTLTTSTEDDGTAAREEDTMVPDLGGSHNTIINHIDDVEENQLVMSDDASVFQRSERHLDNFVDMDEDLDLPDGIEGNAPVTVLPPSIILSPVFTELPTFKGCPVCTNDFPENFTEIYCNSITLRVIVKDARRVKVLHNLSHFLPQPKPIKKYSFLEYDRSCPCPQLHQRGSVHLVTGSSDLWDTGTEKHKIHLTHSVYVIQSTVEKALDMFKSTCSK